MLQMKDRSLQVPFPVVETATSHFQSIELATAFLGFQRFKEGSGEEGEGDPDKGATTADADVGNAEVSAEGGGVPTSVSEAKVSLLPVLLVLSVSKPDASDPPRIISTIIVTYRQ